MSTIFRALSLIPKFRQHSLSGRSNSAFNEISLSRRKKPSLGILVYLTLISITCSSKGFVEFLTSQPLQFTLNSLTLVRTHGNEKKTTEKQKNKKKQTTTEKPKKYHIHYFCGGLDRPFRKIPKFLFK